MSFSLLLLVAVVVDVVVNPVGVVADGDVAGKAYFAVGRKTAFEKKKRPRERERVGARYKNGTWRFLVYSVDITT